MALGTDWSLHDLRHTTIDRMVTDPNLTLPEVIAVTRHRRVSSMAPYLPRRIVVPCLERDSVECAETGS